MASIGSSVTDELYSLLAKDVKSKAGRSKNNYKHQNSGPKFRAKEVQNRTDAQETEPRPARGREDKKFPEGAVGRGGYSNRNRRGNTHSRNQNFSGQQFFDNGMGAGPSLEEPQGHFQRNRTVARGDKKYTHFPGNNGGPVRHQKNFARHASLHRTVTDTNDTSNGTNKDWERPFYKRSQSTHSHKGRSHSPSSERSNENHGRPARKMGYSRLRDLVNQSPTEIVTVLLNSRTGFEELLTADIRPDLLILIVRAFAKACECDFEINKAELLSTACQSDLIQAIEKHLFGMPTDDSRERKQSMATFISDLLVFCEAVMNKFPNTASERFPKLFINTDLIMKGIESYQKVSLSEQKEHFDRLDTQLKNMIEEREHKNVKIKSKEELLKYKPPPDDFREKTVYPTLEDLFDEKKPFIRPNIIEGAYLDVEHYLDVQFRLLREDFVGPLREGLAKLRERTPESKQKRIENVRIYQNVTFENPKVINDQIGLVVNFDSQNKLKINWEYSKRFMFGSLLLFTNDNFNHVVFGTVLDRELKSLKKGTIVVSLHQEGQGLKLFGSSFVMVESEVYFEPYKHVMKALQKLDEMSFPMEKYIIYVQQECDPPRYILQEPFCSYDVDHHQIQLLDELSWPDHISLGLDMSQRAAFKAAITEEFVVIQGPPGTGKTYLGLKIAKVLLQNSYLWNTNKTPILVVCYTNHALDQFLEGLISVTDSIVRVGGQSKSPALSKYNLREQRRGFHFKNSNAHLKRDYHSKLSQIMKAIKIMQANLEELEKHRGIVSLKTLQEKEIVSAQQYSCFEQGSDGDDLLKDWLLQGFEDSYDQYPEEVAERVLENTTNEEQIEEVIEEELEGAWQTADFDPVFLDIGDVTHNMRYAVDLLALEDRVGELLRMSVAMARGQVVDFYLQQSIENEGHWLQQLLQYWKACLSKNHHLNSEHIKQLHATHNLWQLTTEERWLLYKDWLNTLKNLLRSKIHELEGQYRNYAKRYEEIKQICDFEILQNASIVGMTTTNAARLQNLLQALRSKIVIVEEAAEVLESHIVVSLTDRCEHVILIGDHQQLRPNPAVYKLARYYNFDISLFERMVKNGMQCHTLENQHRMRPEIAKLIAPTIYPHLKNDASVSTYPQVSGVTKPLYFITHSVEEEADTEITSHRNRYEADFILALCRHLIWQGYKPDEITVLPTYKGQLFYMKQKQRNMPFLADVKITVVDNYQGEENKIILLSLVRSNKEANIGFLKIENRVCVALSRAREGLYIIGNMDNLAQSSKIWPQIKSSLEEQESFGTHLTLQCQIHPDQFTLVSCASDFKKIPEGGCSLLCKALLECGHQCESVCHVNNRQHTEYKCHKKCERIPEECALGHICPKMCYEECGRCTVLVQRTLPCGHKTLLECHVDVQSYRCPEIVDVELPACSHKVKKPCHRDVLTFPCTVLCPDRLPCGHSCTLRCHATKDPDHLEYKCNKICAKTNAGCTKNHQCQKLCHEECGLCLYEIEVQLPQCDHPHKVKCSENPADVICKRQCTRTMACGHPCRRKCFEPCGGCQVQVKKVVPSCGHQVKTKCCENPDIALCKGPCQKRLPCGHACLRRCNQECIKECREEIPCPVKPLCGHTIQIPCHLRNKADQKPELLLELCRMPCGVQLDCQHKCGGSCGECMQGRIHIACTEKCDRNLICGHKCKVPCSASCPPCTAKCQYKCKHSRCNKKCGEPCTPCKELCGWSCEHLRCSKFCHEICDREPCYKPCQKKLKCEHDCIGFCGDECPPLCRICNEDEVKEIFFGNEDNDNARFVYLVDCEHTLESEGLEQWLEQNDNEITLKTCPRCKSPILRTQRFMNYVKQTLKDVTRVKRKVFGETEVLEKERVRLLKHLSASQSIQVRAYMEQNSKMYAEILRMCEEMLLLVRNNRRNFLSQRDIQSMKSQVEILNDLLTTLVTCIIKPNVPLKSDVKTKLFCRFDNILKKIKQCHGNLSSQQTLEFNKECKRFMRATQLALVESSANFSYALTRGSVSELYRGACAIVDSIAVYTDERHEYLKTVIEHLNKSVGSASVITDRERKEIVQAIGLSQGHWFKCPNGHVYCIGECGGAMQTAKCPECGEAIGGSNHRLLGSNTLASDMDGAQRHAFPGGLH